MIIKKNKRTCTLKRWESFLNTIGGIMAILLVIDVFLLMGYSLLFAGKTKEMLADRNFTILILAFVLILIIVIIVAILTHRLGKKYSIEEKKSRLEVIRDCAKWGMLKESVYIKSGNIMNELLLCNIQRISVDKKDDNNMRIVAIKFSGEPKMILTTLSADKLLSMIDDDTKKKLLENLVENIELDNVTNMLTVGDVHGNSYERTVSDEELLEIFEYKE